jgi:hypothetical protein
MATEIDQFKLSALFANPTHFYQLMVERKGYKPQQTIEFDAELIAPGWHALGCVLLVTMVHHERKAYIVMLSSEDATGLRESLEQQQLAVNTAQLFSRPRLGF